MPVSPLHPATQSSIVTTLQALQPGSKATWAKVAYIQTTFRNINHYDFHTVLVIEW